ncbi:endo alpha-1,4 polygalactosaminidase [uncultured Ruminococcus sp.]|uniref:endo alpha-1,4 polygalactosaminidase n=1 Tax=uncultured Ruminococcus sp. TaxID=165186 RepID=UPI0025CD90DF|nr:endo alpha-1,4 polygalactosaminidase [uncultured Ruminococcus sp.]
MHFKNFLHAVVCCIAVVSVTSACSSDGEIKYRYGVFLGASPEDVKYMEEYEKIVIDAQYFTTEEIAALKNSGHTVYSYINLGSIEDFRPYYKDHEGITLDVYENWEEEKWVDVSKAEWQSFVVDELAEDIIDKGVDGLFVDNTDVYYHYPTDEIFDGVTNILKGFKNLNTYVIINGGDTYVTEYAKRYSELDSIMDAENQETIFSKINWDDETFTSNDSSETTYFQEYVDMVSSYGKDVYLLEYTTDSKLISRIDDYCTKKGYTYYASDKLELLAPAQKKGSQKK